MANPQRPSQQPAAELRPGTQLRSVAPRVRASWLRSKSYGVSPDHVEPVFTGSVDIESLFFECGQQVLQGLHTTLANEPVSLLIADSEGLVLTRLCNDQSMSRSLDRVYLAPGFYFTERNAGTNGLGLSLADRAPALVRADEHYCGELRSYTCAAVPVIDPISGALAGTVNLTTWARSSSELLLALAQSAASNTSALMLVRASGRKARPVPRGEVFHVYNHRFPTDSHDPSQSRVWREAVGEARRTMTGGHVVAVVGEAGAGKTALLSFARRGISDRQRVLNVRPPVPTELQAWLELWIPELAHDESCVVIAHVDSLPAWGAQELAQVLTAALRTGGDLQRFALTASDYSSIPEPLGSLVDTVVEAPALRWRTEDIVPLARYFARQERRREVAFTPAAARALVSYDWPDNVKQLRQVVREAATRTDLIDSRHLPADLFAGSGHALTRLDILERDEIVRCLTEPGVTVAQVAAKLGMGRATVYRKIAQYDIRVPGRGRRPNS